MRTVSQKRNAHNIRRLIVSMAVGAVVGYLIRWARGVEIAPFLCSVGCGAAAILKMREEKA